MKHWKFGASTAERTVNCPGWAEESKGVPRTTSVYANEGNALHDIMEAMLNDDENAAEVAQSFVGKTLHETLITEEHIADRVIPAWNAFCLLCEQYDLYEWEAEVEAEYADDAGTHVDFIAVSEDNKTVVVADWKFGVGVQVEAEHNHQARAGAFMARKASSAADMFMEAETVVLCIIQPNDRG